METVILPKNGGTARIDSLGEEALSDVLALQDAAYAALPADKKRFILRQGAGYFLDLMMRRTGVMIGARTNKGQLVAQMALHGPVTLREAIALRLITKNDVPFHHAALTDNIVVIQSMTAHPDWRGNNLPQNMLAYGMSLPFVQMADHVFAQIAADNRRSWDVFARNNFGIVAAAYDPDDNLPRFIFQKPAFGFDFAPEVIADDVDPIEDFPAIVTLTQREALVGMYDENPTGKLSFLRSNEVLNLMPIMAKVGGRR
ncbi:MAG: hypothetical protein P4M13_00590 [Alphaproteobacteria bacterium]|nr:hypothetical protein [Alphaproteobacteria bacterium]